MIITRTPLRISFFGGGTDFREYFSIQDGAVLSSAIDKYIYVIVKERFDNRIRVGYTKTELVDHLDQLQHELVRECLRLTNITGKIEIATMGDIPSAGSGLGSSSTVTVGLLNALYHYKGEIKDQLALAQEACKVEIEILGKPIGFQDQYAAAFGGQQMIHFLKNGEIKRYPWASDSEMVQALEPRLLLFYTNQTRKADRILEEQVRNTRQNLDILHQIRSLTEEGIKCLQSGDFDQFGKLLHRGWKLKKKLGSRISSLSIDLVYQKAIDAGALGGKITGAGGGGFLLLYCPPEHQNRVRKALKSLPELPFHLVKGGTKVILDVNNR